MVSYGNIKIRAFKRSETARLQAFPLKFGTEAVYKFYSWFCIGGLLKHLMKCSFLREHFKAN